MVDRLKNTYDQFYISVKYFNLQIVKKKRIKKRFKII